MERVIYKIYDETKRISAAMLKIYFLFVLPLLTKQSEITLNKCKNLKCPHQEDLTCVKVAYKKGLKNNLTYVIVYNKCEIGYLKCHPGLKAYVLPMRYCHPSNETTFKRSKRNIKRGVRSFHKIGKGKKLFGELYGDNLSDFSSDNVNVNSKKKLSNKKLNKAVENDKDKSNDETDDDTPRMESSEALVELNSTSRERRTTPTENGVDDVVGEKVDPDSIHVIDEDQDESLEDALKDTDAEATDGVSNNDKNDVHNEKIRIDPNSGEKKADFNDDLKVADDYDHTEVNNANLEEDNKDCPSTCATRNMMVCARCNHGVYRTFMSVCHLRAFLCMHTDEKLSLVSRRPCIQSAPFLSELPPSDGRVIESTDNDKVLQFIRCRAEDRLDKGDHKCTFER